MSKKWKKKSNYKYMPPWNEHPISSIQNYLNVLQYIELQGKSSLVDKSKIILLSV